MFPLGRSGDRRRGRGSRGRRRGGGRCAGGAAVDELGQIGVPVLERERGRRVAAVVDDARVGTPREQRLDDVRLTQTRREHERGLAVLFGLGVGLRAVVEQRAEQPRIVEHGGDEQRVVELAVAGELILAGDQQHVHDAVVVGVGGSEQRRQIFLVVDPHVGVAFDQGPHGVGLVGGSGEDERRVAVLVLEIGVGVLVEEQLGHVDLPGSGGRHQRGDAATVDGVAVHPAAQKRFHQTAVALRGGLDEVRRRERVPGLGDLLAGAVTSTPAAAR